MKPVLFLALVLVGVSMVGVFHVEHQVQEIRSELSSLNKQIVEDKHATHVLKAEWTYLNQPERLQQMASRYLDMDVMLAQQFNRMIPAAGGVDGPVMVAEKQMPKRAKPVMVSARQ